MTILADENQRITHHQSTLDDIRAATGITGHAHPHHQLPKHATHRGVRSAVLHRPAVRHPGSAAEVQGRGAAVPHRTQESPRQRPADPDVRADLRQPVDRRAASLREAGQELLQPIERQDQEPRSGLPEWQDGKAFSLDFSEARHQAGDVGECQGPGVRRRVPARSCRPSGATRPTTASACRCMFLPHAPSSGSSCSTAARACQHWSTRCRWISWRIADDPRPAVPRRRPVQRLLVVLTRRRGSGSAHGEVSRRCDCRRPCRTSRSWHAVGDPAHGGSSPTPVALELDSDGDPWRRRRGLRIGRRLVGHVERCPRATSRQFMFARRGMRRRRSARVPTEGSMRPSLPIGSRPSSSSGDDAPALFDAAVSGRTRSAISASRSSVLDRRSDSLRREAVAGAVQCAGDSHLLREVSSHLRGRPHRRPRLAPARARGWLDGGRTTIIFSAPCSRRSIVRPPWARSWRPSVVEALRAAPSGFRDLPGLAMPSTGSSQILRGESEMRRFRGEGQRATKAMLLFLLRPEPEEIVTWDPRRRARTRSS